MFSFRKIINILVLISYVKMTIVSSFAMDSAYFGLNHKIRIEMTKTKAGGELESMSFRVYTKDGSLSTKPPYKLIQQDSINLVEGHFSEKVTPFRGQHHQLIQWDIAGLGTVIIDPNGEVTFKGMTNTHNTIQIVTPGIVMFQACALANVSLRAQGAAISDGSRIGYLKAKLAKLGSLMLVGTTEQRIGNLDLFSGHLHNFSQLSILANSRWNLHGNAAINYANISIGASANFVVDNALFFVNLNRITGNRLVLLGRQNAITEDDVATQMALMTNMSTLLPQLLSINQFSNLTDTILNYLVPVIGQSLNLGKIDLQNFASNSAKFKNAEIGSITIRDGSQSTLSNLKNEGLFKIQASSSSVPVTIDRLSNDGILDYASRLVIDRSKFGSSSHLIARTIDAIQFLTPTILRGTLAQAMPMTLQGRVTNKAIFEVLPDLLAPSFTLNVDGSFDNHISMDMAHDLFLTGGGLFTNYAELKTKRFVASARVANHNLISATDIQVESPVFSNSEGRVIASSQVQINGDILDNSNGQIFAGGKVTTQIKSLDNTNGVIDGVDGTNVTLTGTNFNGSGGRIGNVGETNLTFAQNITVEDIGTVAGDKTRLKEGKSSQTVTINKGVVEGKTIAHILLSNITANVDFATPLLYISSPHWRLSNQAQAARTMVSVLPTQNYQLINAYRTKGTLELWQNGIHSLTDIEKHWESLYGDKTTEKPAPTHTVSILASLQADKGFKFYLPQATLHINDNAVGDMTELLCPDSQLHMRVAKFDLERGCVAALTADSWAVHGHHIGRLVEDPTRKVFASFFNPTSSHNLGGYITNVSLRFDGKTYDSVYDGHHLLTLPFFVANGSQFIVRDTSSLRGHVVQRALYNARQTTLDTGLPSTFVGSISNFEDTLHLKGSGNITSSLPIGVVDFTYNGSEQRSYEFRVGDPDSFRAGVMQSDQPLEFLTLASDSHVDQFVGEVRKPCHEHNAPLKSIVVDMAGDQGKTYARASRNDFTQVRYMDRLWNVYTSPDGTESIRMPGNVSSWPYRNFEPLRSQFCQHWSPVSYAVYFYHYTQGLKGGTHLHVPHSSSVDGGMTLVDTNTRIEGIVQTSRALFAVAQGSHFVLGTNNPYFIPKADPVRNLMEGKFHSFNIHLTPDLRAMLDRVNAPQFLFAMRARFWHDDAASQEFYAPIINDVVVYHPRDGFRKIQGRAVFSLSPELLLERVRSEVQTVLLRGYVDDNTTIDLAYLQQLHRNASEYFRECTLDAPSVSRALVSGRAHTLPDVTKPMLIYTSMINEQGVEELSPRLIIPPAMIDEMRKAKGGYVRTNVLAILDNTVTLDEALHLYRDQPKLVADLKRYAEQNPDSVAQWDARAKRAKELKGDPLATEKMLQEFGSTTLLGTIKVGQLGINTSTPLFIRADIDAQDAFLKSLCDIMIQSEKGRVYTSRENFYERITTQARIHVAGLLKIITAENLTMESVKTHSGLGTEMKALGSIFDIPIELISHSVMVEHGKKKTTRTETTRTTNVGSNHSSDATISQTAGANILHQKVHYEAKEKLRFTAGENIESRDAHDTEQTKRETTKEGTFRTKTTTECSGSSTSKSSTYKTADAGFKAERGNATFTNTIFDCLTTNIETLQGLTSFLLGVNDAYYSCVKSSMGAAWSRTSMINEQHRTYAQSKILGKMHVHSKETLIQLVEGQSQEILDLIEVEGGPVVKQFLKEMHKHERKVIQGPGQALMAIIAVAMTILTQGAAAPLAAKIGLGSGLVAKAVMGAVLSAVGTQLTAATMQNKGNPFKAAKTLATKEFLKSLAIKMASAGLTAGVMAHFKIEVPDASAADKLSNADLFLKQMAYNTMQETVGIGVRATLGGEKLEDLLKDGLINIGVGSIAQFIATKIGAARYAQLKAENNSLSDYMLHKMYHGILGAGRGAALAALRGEDVGSAALGGSIGGIVAEVVAEGMRGSINQRIIKRVTSGESDEGKIQSEELARISSMGQGAAIIFATLFKCDIGQAQGAASNAIENNFVFAIMPMIAGAMKLYDILTTCQGAIEAYDEGGPEALVKYGVEEASINLLMSSSMKFVSKMVNKARLAVKDTFKASASSASSSASSGARAIKDVPLSEAKAAKTSKPVRDMSDREYVQSLADRADKRFEGKGPRVGTKKHKYAEQVHKRYQRMTGERRHMEAEKRFDKGEYWEKGMDVKGSSRADMYNKRTNEAYDYKFGDAKLSSRQQQKYEANLPRNGNDAAKVHETKPMSSRL